jgi:UDP-N-acetyl-D-mannosaminuronate dehydrogenase
MFTSVDKGNKVTRCLEGKKQESEVIALSRLIVDIHRGLRIAFAEDLYLYCQANNIDFTELRAALNTKWNVNVPDPKGGIVHSIKRDDNKTLSNYSSKLRGCKTIDAIFNVDHEYKESKKITNDDIH